jgi:hypothetical protein
MADFLATCKTAYACSLNEELPLEGYSFATFVELKLKIQGMVVSVGNKSRPPYNTACITSLQYGASSGNGAVIEIVDEEGGTFSKSFEALNKGLGNLGKELEAFELDFGWIVGSECGTNTSAKKISVYTETGSYINLIPRSMKVSYGQGTIRYTLESQDNLNRVAEARVEASIGRDDAKVPLKQAIKQFMRERLPPPMLDVEFVSADDPTKEFNFKNSEGGKLGPKSVWLSMQQNKLATLRRWINPLRTSNDKGIIVLYERTGKIILRENPAPDKCAETNRCSQSLGTYIVNGGKNSNVVEFAPQVDWNLTGASGTGGAASPASGAGKKKSGLVCGKQNKNDKVGAASGVTAAGTMNYFAPDEAAAKSERADAANEIALGPLEGTSPIEAELTVTGDPRIVFPDQLNGGDVISIIVINPFHLRTKSADGCPDWLAEPVCNATFSNRFWEIKGVDHQISAGSYKTTYKVYLPVPNVQLDIDDPIGGKDSGGPTLDIKTAPQQK